MVRMAGDEADASMPQADQITGHVARGGTVVGADLQPFTPDSWAPAAHRACRLGPARRSAPARRTPAASAPRRRRRAGAPPARSARPGPRRGSRRAAAAGCRNSAGTRPAPLLDVDQVVVAGIVVHQHDEVGALAGQPARGWIGLVLQQLDRGHDLGARLLAGVRLVVEHARHGLDGHARLGGHIIDRDGTRSLPLAMPQHSTMLTASPARGFLVWSSCRSGLAHGLDDRVQRRADRRHAAPCGRR